MQCSECNSKNTTAVRLDQIDKILTEQGIQREPGATSGKMNLTGEDIFNILGLLFSLASKVFDYLTEKEKNNPPCLLCKDCGHWEIMKKDI